MSSRISSPRFVGRRAELEALDSFLRAADAGEGGAMLIAGEAGMGKSRLVAETEARARALGAEVLVGECLQLADGELAFAPVVSALRSVARGRASAELSGPLRAALATLWPADREDEPPAAGRDQLFEAIYGLLALLSAERLVLLVVEDIHWIDRSSRDLLAFLARAVRRDRLAVLATFRTDELERGHPLLAFVTETERAGRAQRIDLEPLGREEVIQQMTAILGHSPQPCDAERIFSRCEGNPFFAEELLASAHADLDQMPSSMREALLLRLERLTPSTRMMLRAAATIGRTFDHRLLVSVIDRPESELMDSLREATEHHVLVLADGGTAYAFRHALVRDAIYTDALPGERLRLHRAIAQTLSDRPERAPAGANAELAYHWQAAGESGPALAASLAAAAEGERVHAYAEALVHLERALELWDEVEGAEAAAGDDRTGLELRAAQLADWAGEGERTMALASGVRGRIDERREPERAARAQLLLGQALFISGRDREAADQLAQAVALLPSEPTAERAEMLSAYARQLMLIGLHHDAKEPLDEALALARELGEPLVESDALTTQAVVCSELGERERAIEVGLEALRIAGAIGAAEQLFRAYINAAQALDDAGQIDESHALGLEGLAEAPRFGMMRRAGDQLAVQAAWRLHRLGRWREAEALAQQVREKATTPFMIAAGAWIWGRIALDRGLLDDAEPALAYSWSINESSQGGQTNGLILAALITLELYRGRLERAREWAGEALARAAQLQGELIYNCEPYWLACRVEVELAERERAAGRGQEATAAREAAAAALSAMEHAVALVPDGSAPPEALAYKALAEAEISRLARQPEPARWLAAADMFSDLGQRPREAYGRLRFAEALALAGADARDVAPPLREAYATAVELGADPLRKEVVGLARRAGVAVEEDRAESASERIELGLTARELEVLGLLAEGLTNKQIGGQLFITPKTASVHVSRILMKLGVANRAQAAVIAQRLELARRE